MFDVILNPRVYELKDIVLMTLFMTQTRKIVFRSKVVSGPHHLLCGPSWGCICRTRGSSQHGLGTYRLTPEAVKSAGECGLGKARFADLNSPPNIGRHFSRVAKETLGWPVALSLAQPWSDGLGAASPPATAPVPHQRDSA